VSAAVAAVAAGASAAAAAAAARVRLAYLTRYLTSCDTHQSNHFHFYSCHRLCCCCCCGGRHVYNICYVTVAFTSPRRCVRCTSCCDHHLQSLPLANGP
jgi:hypothetical protein